MAREREGGLQIIFAIFLGLMVTAFVGVGVNTLYPAPDAPFVQRIRELNRQEQAAVNSKAPADLTPIERAKIQQIRDEINKTQDELRVAVAPWGRTTSIILIVFATLAMAISLIRADQLPVVSNGLLLGGAFTMIYGVGTIITTGASGSRFGVMTAAFLITLGLGYARFVRGRARVSTTGEQRTASAGLADVEQRLRNLEKRMEDAASALGRGA